MEQHNQRLRALELPAKINPPLAYSLGYFGHGYAKTTNTAPRSPSLTTPVTASFDCSQSRGYLRVPSQFRWALFWRFQAAGVFSYVCCSILLSPQIHQERMQDLKKKGRLSFKYEQFLSQGNSYFGTKLKHVSRNKEKVGSCWGHSPHSRPPSAYVNSAANARKCSALTSWRFSTVHWPDPGSLSGSSLFGQLKQEQAQARHSKLRLNFTKYLWPLHQ